MPTRYGATLAFVVIAGLTAACGDSPPTTPSPTPGTPTVSRVEPSSGPTDTAFPVAIHGTGFQSGATVSLGGQAATVTAVTSSMITATAPARASGAVDVVVTNPNGRRATLAGGFTYVPFAITSISPNAGSSGSVVRITGTGFLTGAVVTFDGVAATTSSITPTVITATAPDHPTGEVDVVVANPGGHTTMVSQGFRYATPTLTVATTEVRSGQDLIVSWAVPGPTSALDWIGLFHVGSANQEYLDSHWIYTGGATTGTHRFFAPSAPGQYEFRYLLDDGYIDIVRSQTITVLGVPEALISLLTNLTTPAQSRHTRDQHREAFFHRRRLQAIVERDQLQ